MNNFRLITKLGLLLTLMFLLACQPTPSTPPSTQTGPTFISKNVENSFKEVMAIHDEVMPFISEMKKDKKKLLSLKEKEDLESEQITQIDQAIVQLEKGDSLMFAWMKGFKTPDSKMKEKEALPYLAKEKDKVSVVNSEMKLAIKQAKSILDQTSSQ